MTDSSKACVHCKWFRKEVAMVNRYICYPKDIRNQFMDELGNNYYDSVWCGVWNREGKCEFFIPKFHIETIPWYKKVFSFLFTGKTDE